MRPNVTDYDFPDHCLLPWCFTPALSHRWHRSGRLTSKLSWLITGRRSRSSQGMSVIPPAPEQTTRMVLP